jgi:hypothetical protein
MSTANDRGRSNPLCQRVVPGRAANWLPADALSLHLVGGTPYVSQEAQQTHPVEVSEQYRSLLKQALRMTFTEKVIRALEEYEAYQDLLPAAPVPPGYSHLLRDICMEADQVESAALASEPISLLQEDIVANSAKIQRASAIAITALAFCLVWHLIGGITIINPLFSVAGIVLCGSYWLAARAAVWRNVSR